MKLIKSFLKYQHERFPLAVLIPISLSGVIGASAILGVHNLYIVIFATCLTLTFLFHVRVIDEIRDFSHDSFHHPDRPVQKNIISIKNLRTLRLLSLVLFFGISLFSLNTFIFSVALFLYSSLAANDFFCPNTIRKHFYVYNLLNMVQLIGLQMAVYTMFGWNFYFSRIIFAHIVLVFLLSALLEVVRKIKTKEHETTGKDTYSHHMGYKGSILLFSSILVLILFPTGYVFYIVGKMYGIIIPIVICALGLFVAMMHYIKKNLGTEKFLSLISFIYYLIVNAVMYSVLK